MRMSQAGELRYRRKGGDNFCDFELLLGLFGCHKSSHIVSYIVNAFKSNIVDYQKSLVIQTPEVVGLHLFIQNLLLINRTLTALYACEDNLKLFPPV